MLTLGDVITIGLIVAALAIVPYKLVKAHFGTQIGRAWASLVSIFSEEARPAGEKLPEWLARDRDAGITAPVSKPVSVLDTDTAGFDLAAVPPDLTYAEIVTILAVQTTPTGKPLYSGRKIYTLVGGNYNEFTALMRQLRSKDDAPAEPEKYRELDEQRRPVLG